MFHIGRSGSTVLSDMLNDHFSVYWDGEVFYESTPLGPEDSPPVDLVSSRWRTSKYYPDLPYKFIESQAARASGLTYGCEVKFYHLFNNSIRLNEFVQQLSDLGFDRFIVLKRKNFLRKIVSSAIALQTGRYHQPTRSKQLLTQISVDPLAIRVDGNTTPLLERLEKFDNDFNELATLLQGRKVLELSYEDHIEADPRVAYRMACDFLAITPKDVAIRYSKTNPYPLRELIRNFEDFAESLRNTRFEWMLED